MKGCLPAFAAAVVAAFLAGPPALAQPAAGARGPWLHAGLLRQRDLSPFGFLRLDMRPAHALDAPPGTWAVEAELGYQNTWALSPNVQDYLRDLPGRRSLGPREVEAIRALPGEKYLVDLELGLLDLAVHHKLDPRWSVYAIASAVSYGGGFLDGVIESFHEAFGFDDFSRPALGRDAFNVILDLKDVHYVARGPARRGGLLDPTVGVRFSALGAPNPWNLVVEAAAKVPIAGRRAYLSNGHPEFGMQVTLQRFAGRHAAYASLAAVRTRGDLLGQGDRSRIVPAMIAGYEYALGSHASVVAQVNASRSAVGRSETNLDTLLRDKYQASLGMRWRIGGSLLSLAITENVANFNNTPDVGLQLGWACCPEPGWNPR